MFEITHYKPINKGSLQGTFNLKVLKWGNFIIRDMSYFVKGEKKWVSFPSRIYQKDGETKYFPYMAFEDQEMQKTFQSKVMEALEAVIKTESPRVITDMQQGEIPF
jgi:hypothetical protein